MTEEDWDSGFGRSIAVYLNGQGIPDRDARGERVADDSFLLAFSAHDAAIEFTVPPAEYGEAWQVVVDTMEAAGDQESTTVKAGESVSVGPRAIVVLQRADA
jgi:glycogen operon protein